MSILVEEVVIVTGKGFFLNVIEAYVNSVSVWTIADGAPPSPALIQQQDISPSFHLCQLLGVIKHLK